ncbi:MAG: LytR family transcriptional regulator [Butyrivibrio sp.]|nr:LytR family transcriptional regulator [Butyrivibrio sp.]
MRNRTVILLSALLTLLIIVVIMTGSFFAIQNNTNNVTRSEDSAASSSLNTFESQNFEKDQFDGSIIYQGQRYEVNTFIDTVLFLGIDSSDQDRNGIGIKEGGRSDVIILFIIDNRNKTITPFEINRDTMVNVDIYDNEGNYLTQGLEQITMQYSYGISTSKACRLTKEKVSDLLGRTKIDSIISLTMDGIEPIVDSIGGVTLKLQSDETALNPSYCKDAIIHLDGTSAKEFVRSRDTEIRGSNIERMSRQTQFMLALFQNIKGKGDAIVETMENAAGGYLYKDIDADSISHMTQYDYSERLIVLPGYNNISNQHDEFYVDEEKLTETILDLFYIKQ